MYIKILKISVLVVYNLAFGVSPSRRRPFLPFRCEDISGAKVQKKNDMSKKSTIFLFFVKFPCVFQIFVLSLQRKYVAYEKIYDFDGPDGR